MGRPKELECVSCEAVFKVGHDMSENHYFEKYCVYCGEVLDLEEGYDVEDPIEEDIVDEW